MKSSEGRIKFPGNQGRRVEAEFSAGGVTSDGGILIIREMDRKLGLTAAVAEGIEDEREAGKRKHEVEAMVKQRVYGLMLGYEDVTDHNQVREDLGLRLAVGKEGKLASGPTLCRLEQQASRELAWHIHGVMFEQFVKAHPKGMKQVVLDFDGTDDAVHGEQEGRGYNTYYGGYCFQPLYVFCGTQLLVSYLRPGNVDGARHAWAILALLVKALRRVWPGVEIVFRGDGGFCRPHLLEWCDRQGVKYVVGMAKNERLLRFNQDVIEQAKFQFETTQTKHRLFGECQYAAHSWQRERRLIVKAEHSADGANPRFVATNLTHDPETLYTLVYCERGEMENRIKEQKLDLFAGRTSCHRWWPNQLRLLWSSLAYILMETLRRTILFETELASAQAGTIRLKLFKIGGVIVQTASQVRFFLSSAYPWQSLFRQVARHLCAS